MWMLLAIAAPLALIGLLDDDDDTGAERVPLDGSEGDDTILGGSANELIQGYQGDDELFGGEGDDTVFGQGGDDLLVGNAGNDMLCSGDGDDFISGQRGADFIEGQEGDDWISADYNDDRAFGNEGNDTIIGGRNNDAVLGNAGDDVLFGGILRGLPLDEDEMRDLADGVSLEAILNRGGLDIDLREDDQSDTLAGGEGDDMLFVGAADVATGGAGADTFHITVDDDYEDRPVPTITDFNGRVDSIVVVFDVNVPVSEVTVEQAGDDAIVLADGVRVGLIEGGAGSVTADMISLVTEDSVVGMFDPNAPVAA